MPFASRSSALPTRRAHLVALFTGIALAQTTLVISVTNATTFIPMTIEDLTDSSAAVVIGQVVTVTAVEASDGAILTQVDVDVASVLKGDPELPRLTLREPGGTLGDRREVIFGAPRFQQGEEVVVFVAPGPNHTWRTNQLALGKFRVTAEDGEAPRAVQDLGSGVTVLLPTDGPPWSPSLPLAELITRVERAVGQDPMGARSPTQAEPSTSTASGEVTAPFNLFPDPGRLFEPDEGRQVGFLIDDRGDSVLGLRAARQAIGNAFAAWTDVSSATIELVDRGLTSDLGRGCVEGEHKVLFDDPHNEIPNPVRCTGTLGIGGYCSTEAESKTFNGTTFDRALRARLTLADNWQGCKIWNACNVAEIATHEIGHAIGIFHSSEDSHENDQRLEDATMYFLAHFDGRCAAVRGDDVDAATFLYPTALPPTITTASPLPEGVGGQPYGVSLTAIGGSGSFTWSEARNVCAGFPGLRLTAAGTIEGTPRAFGQACFQAVITDSNGDEHVKRLDISVVQTAPTATRTASSSPTPPTTATPPVGASCTGDCNQDGSVTIDEVIRGVNVGLGLQDLAACPVFDENRDGIITINEIIRAVGFGLNVCA